MARTANPDKPKIDALRAEGKIHVTAIKEGAKALKKLLAVNAKLVKFDSAEIPVPETEKVAAKSALKAAEKPKTVAKVAKAKVEEKPKLAKGKAAKSVTTAPKKRGRPAKADSDELDFG